MNVIDLHSGTASIVTSLHETEEELADAGLTGLSCSPLVC
jgi:hypothetical protein